MNEPSRAGEIAKYTLGAAVLVAACVGAIFYLNRGSQVRLEGRIIKVRAIPTGEGASLALVDFRVSNPANVRFIVRDVTFRLIKEDGTEVDGLVSSQTDLDRVIGYFPAFGPRYNDVLKAKSQLAGGVQADWCVGAGFDFDAAGVERRRDLVLSITDVDGVVVEIREKQKQ